MPLLVGHFVQHGVAIDPGIIHENVQAAITIENIFHDGIALAGLRHVEAHAAGLLATIPSHTLGL